MRKYACWAGKNRLDYMGDWGGDDENDRKGTKD
jgi:hypothetical protein